MPEMDPGVRPIIFGPDSLKGIVSGDKTQTRRVVKGQPNEVRWGTVVVGNHRGWIDDHGKPVPCRFTEGERLWVKEAHQLLEVEPGKVIVVYRCGSEDGFNYVFDDSTVAHLQVDKWRSPIFMPKEASRLSIDITGVRAERLHAIREPDVIAEGFGYLDRPINGFVRAWNDLNSKRGFPWHENPWVWVIDFRRATT